MAGTYRTFMVDPLGALKPGLGNAIQSQLALLFSPIVGYNNFFENNWVLFNPTAATPVSHELLVYFMPAQVSVIKNLPNHQPLDLSSDGNTAYSSGASEVYVKYSDPVMLAKLAFHELMHNRLRQSNQQLHPQGGLASETINPGTALTDKNIKSMAAVLRNPIAQWADGISILNNGKIDPLSEYYKV